MKYPIYLFMSSFGQSSPLQMAYSLPNPITESEEELIRGVALGLGPRELKKVRFFNHHSRRAGFYLCFSSSFLSLSQGSGSQPLHRCTDFVSPRR